MRFVSGIVAIAYLVVAWFAIDAAAAFRLAIFLILPLACIWFSDAIGAYTGPGFGRAAVTSASPAWMVAVGGWVLLLLPLVLGLLWRLDRAA